MTELEKTQKDYNKANTNLVLMGLLHFFFAFFASLGYAISLEYWKPFLFATLAAFVSAFMAAIVGGIIGFIIGSSGGSSDAAGAIGILIGIPFGFIPPLVSFLMFRSRVKALRSRVQGM